MRVPSGSMGMHRAAVAMLLFAACRESQPVVHEDASAPRCPPSAPVALPCPEPAAAAVDGDAVTLSRVDFEELPGWADDRHAEALPAFLASCSVLAGIDDDAPIGTDPHSGKARDWRPACAAAARVPAGDHGAARAFFEAEFVPFAAHGSDGPKAKLSGYFVQALSGSRTRDARYRVPILARPDDLVSVELSAFIPDGRSRRIWGRVVDGALVAYPTRAEIRRDLSDDDALLWVDDPVDALFAEIEGSGVVAMDDGRQLWIRFAGKNGRPYRGVGGILRAMGELERGQGTMDGIRAWFDAHPERFDPIVDLNQARVFFELTEEPGAVGTQGVVLTPRRSMAVDRAFIALSTPVWVDTRAPRPGVRGEPPWRGLLIAQDTGGAILGPIRGDLYWGADREAADIGGRMGAPGRMWLLLPRTLAP
jgi:membrane-bound lytic murein transglycosylase A